MTAAKVDGAFGFAGGARAHTRVYQSGLFENAFNADGRRIIAATAAQYLHLIGINTEEPLLRWLHGCFY